MLKKNKKKIKNITLDVMKKLDWTKVEYKEENILDVKIAGNYFYFKSGWEMRIAETTIKARKNLDEVKDWIELTIDVSVAATLIEEKEFISGNSKWVIPQNVLAERKIIDKILRKNDLEFKSIN